MVCSRGPNIACTLTVFDEAPVGERDPSSTNPKSGTSCVLTLLSKLFGEVHCVCCGGGVELRRWWFGGLTLVQLRELTLKTILGDGQNKSPPLNANPRRWCPIPQAGG